MESTVRTINVINILTIIEDNSFEYKIKYLLLLNTILLFYFCKM